MRKNARGFTLLEVFIVLGVMAAVATYVLPRMELKADQAFAEHLSDRYLKIERAALRYRRDHSAWPVNVNALVSGGYLTADDAQDPWGTAFTVGPDGSGNLRVSSNVREQKYVARTRSLVPNPSVSGTVLSSTIDPPGEEPAHDALYARNGSRALTGHMNGGGWDITNITNLSANGAIVSGGNIQAGGSLISGLNIHSAGNIHAVGNVEAGGRLQASGNVQAGADLRGRRFVDTDNTALYVDPASRSFLNALDVSSIRDRDNTAYVVDPDSASRLNYVDANYARLRNNYTAGTECTTGQIGTTSTGEFLSCVNSRWAHPASSGGIKDVCMSSATPTTANCSQCTGGSAGWVLMGWWDVDSGGGAGRRSITGGMGHEDDWLMTLCVKP